MKHKKSADTVRKLVCWVLAFFFLIITTYPYSPFFYQFLIGKASNVYLALLLATVIVSILLKNRSLHLQFKVRFDTFSTLQVLIFVSLIATLITTQNPTAARDLLAYTAIFILIFFIRNEAFTEVLTTKYLLASILVAISMALYTLLFLFPEIRSDWLVSDLLLNKENPIVTRHEYGDFEYSMLFYHSTVLFDAKLGKYLLGSIFTEPTGVFVFLLGPLFFCLQSAKFKGRLFTILVLSVYMMGTLSVYPIIVLLLGVAIGFSVLSLRPSNTIFNVLVISVPVVIWMAGPMLLSVIVSLIPTDKAMQLDYYFSPEDIVGFRLGSSVFGLAEVPGGNSWGGAVLIFRYGYFGFLVWVSLVIFYLVEACRFLLDRGLSKGKRFFSFMALFCATLMSLKVPNMLLVTSLLIYLGLGYKKKEDAG